MKLFVSYYLGFFVVLIISISSANSSPIIKFGNTKLVVEGDTSECKNPLPFTEAVEERPATVSIVDAIASKVSLSNINSPSLSSSNAATNVCIETKPMLLAATDVPSIVTPTAPPTSGKRKGNKPHIADSPFMPPSPAVLKEQALLREADQVSTDVEVPIRRGELVSTPESRRLAAAFPNAVGLTDNKPTQQPAPVTQNDSSKYYSESESGALVNMASSPPQQPTVPLVVGKLY